MVFDDPERFANFQFLSGFQEIDLITISAKDDLGFQFLSGFQRAIPGDE